MATIVVFPVLVSQCNIMYCRTQVAGPKTGEIRGLNQDNRPGHVAANGLLLNPSLLEGWKQPEIIEPIVPHSGLDCATVVV